MTFDLLSISAMTAVVVIVAGCLFLIETVKRKESAAGLWWAAAFIAGMLTTLCYLAWSVDPDAWTTVALGNASFVASTGCMWLGSRRFNRASLKIPSVAVAAAVTITFFAALLQGPDGGDWAGAPATFTGIGVLALLGGFEASRGRMGRQISSVGLAVVLVLEGAYFLVRTVVFLGYGGESEIFQAWFGTIPTSFVTVILTLVAVVAMSVLRASETGLAAVRTTTSLSATEDGFLLGEAFEWVFRETVIRAERTQAPIGVIAMRLDDMPEVVTAFGTSAAQQIVSIWRGGIGRYAPAACVVGESSPTRTLIGFHPSSAVEAERMASALHRQILAELSTAETVITPSIAIGLAVSDICGYDADALIRAAEEAADRSASSLDASVIVAREPLG